MSESFTCEGMGLRSNRETSPEGEHLEAGERRGPLDQDMPHGDEFAAPTSRREADLMSSEEGENDHPVNRLSATGEHNLSPELDRRNLHWVRVRQGNKGNDKRDKNKGKKKKKSKKKNGKLGRPQGRPQQMMDKPQKWKPKKPQKPQKCDANAQRQCCKRAEETNFFTYCSNRNCEAERCKQYKDSPMVQWASANGIDLAGDLGKGKGKGKRCKCWAKPYNAAAENYKANDKVEFGCDIYKCKGDPFTPWCSNVAYAPNSEYGAIAWELVESC